MFLVHVETFITLLTSFLYQALKLLKENQLQLAAGPGIKINCPTSLNFSEAAFNTYTGDAVTISPRCDFQI